MKKFLSVFLLSLIVIASAFSTGCYRLKAAKKSEIAGTYELVRYSRSSTGEDDEGNYKAKKGIESYLVISEEGKGYYIYKDNNTPLYCVETSVNFIESEEERGKYEYVEMDMEVKPLASKMGYRNGYLNIGVMDFTYVDKIKYEGMLYTDYKKVNKDQSLSYILKKFPDISVYKRGEYVYKGYFDSYVECDGVEDSEAQIFVYYVMKLDTLNKKAKAYYMYKSDMQKQEKEFDLSVSIGAGAFSDVYKIGIDGKVTDGSDLTVKDGSHYSVYFYRMLRETIGETERDVKLNFFKCSGLTDENIDENIETYIENYRSSLENNEQ